MSRGGGGQPQTQGPQGKMAQQRTWVTLTLGWSELGGEQPCRHLWSVSETLAPSRPPDHRRTLICAWAHSVAEWLPQRPGLHVCPGCWVGDLTPWVPALSPAAAAAGRPVPGTEAQPGLLPAVETAGESPCATASPLPPPAGLWGLGCPHLCSVLVLSPWTLSPSSRFLPPDL